MYKILHNHYHEMAKSGGLATSMFCTRPHHGVNIGAVYMI